MIPMCNAFSRGTVSRVDSNGVLTTLVNDDRIQGNAGIQVDVPRNKVYIAICDLFALYNVTERFLGFAAADLTSGTVVVYKNASNIQRRNRFVGSLMFNDLVQDKQGNVFLTESVSGSIYLYNVTADTLSLWYTTAAWQNYELSGIFLTLNGIEYIPSLNALLVGKSGNGKVWKVPIENPSALTQVTFNGNTPIGLDGMFLKDNTTMIISSDGATYEVVTSDMWNSATITRTTRHAPLVGGTTNVVVNGEAYTLFTHFEQAQNVSYGTYEIVRTISGPTPMVSTRPTPKTTTKPSGNANSINVSILLLVVLLICGL